MSEEPSIPVSAAATMPPVQDSAVASLRPPVRQAASTSSAFAIKIASDKAEPHEHEKHQPGIECCEDIVEHDAEPAVQRAVGPVRRERLDDVGDTEEYEADSIGERIGWSHGEDEPLRRNLVNDDEAGIANAAGASDSAGGPATNGEDDGRRKNEADRAEGRADVPGEGEGGERTRSSRDLRQQAGTEPGRQQDRGAGKGKSQ